MASIREVAEKAGVSISTVSRVVSGSAKVDPDTRARVEGAISETGYRPNLNARSLRSRSGQLVGLVVPKIMHETFSTIIHFVEREAHKMGYGLIVGNTYDNADREREFIDDLLSRNVDAILFSRVSDSSRLPVEARERSLPIVVIDRGIEHEEIPSVELDNREAGRLVANLFRNGGHRNIAMVSGPQNVRLARERGSAFKTALKEADIDLPPSHCFEGSFEFDTGINAAQQILKLDPLPTAIWAVCDAIAVGLMHRFARSGVRIPEDISIVGMDNVPMARMVHPTLTTVEQPFEEICTRAFEIIHRQLEDSSYRPVTNPVLVRPSIIVRESYRNLE